MKSPIKRRRWLNIKYYNSFFIHMKSHFKTYLECYWPLEIEIKEKNIT